MKHHNFLVFLFAFCLSTNALMAQNTERRWSFSGAFSGIDFKAPEGGAIFDSWNPGISLLVGRSLNSSFNLTTSLSLNQFAKNGAPNAGFETNIEPVGSSIFDADLGIQFRFANGKIMKEDSWFDPYIQAGVGLHVLEKARGLIYGGAGINFWLFNGAGNDQIGLFVQTDYDYLPSFNEALHHKIGIKVRFGGKVADADGDGIADKDDACPQVAGLKTMGGCPDSDNDGIADKDDACPQVAGSKDMNGCPDTDKDGIADDKDKCPQTAGLAKFGGCPDTDGDGVPDKNDACPQVAGLTNLSGCPDSDGDGIADKDDPCPKTAGTLNGCPDTDKDGIADKDDKCPKVAGIKRLQGCPEPKKEEINVEEVEKKLSISAHKIQFNTGSSVIKQSSYVDLKKVLTLMQTYSKSKFRIEGHTDNVGNPARNKALSQRRANAVKKYFTDKGISASRISATGYGDAKPVTTNNTPQGRKENRRVEIHLAE